MRTIRIHVDQVLTAGNETTVGGAPAEHVLRVLRMNVGGPLTLFNGDGCDYPAIISACSRRELTLQVEAAQTPDNESPLQLTLAQGIARGDKMDLIVQKATELGVSHIVPLLTERSGVKLDAERAQKRLLHWHAVAISACEQCGRARIPQISPVQSLQEWIAELADDGAARLALMPLARISARNLDLSSKRAVLAIGPEGGLGARDLQALHEARFEGLRLGPRILRTETAGLTALAALQALHGDL